MSTMPCGRLGFRRPNAFAGASPVSEFVLTPAERVLLQALEALGVRYLLVGMGAALIEGAHGTTQDLDLWFGRVDGTRKEPCADSTPGSGSRGETRPRGRAVASRADPVEPRARQAAWLQTADSSCLGRWERRVTIGGFSTALEACHSRSTSLNAHPDGHVVLPQVSG